MLSLTLIYAGAASVSGTILGILALAALGLMFAFIAWRLYAATADQLLLTRDGLVTASGETIASFDNIDKIDRATFAILKPSNGFAINLKTSMPRGWAPGLWWRMGKRVGIGGATNPGQGKAMADMMTTLAGPDRDVVLNQIDQS